MVHDWSLVSLSAVEGKIEESCEHSTSSASFPAWLPAFAAAAAWWRLGLAWGADSSRFWVGKEVDALARLLTQQDVEGDP